MYDMYILFIEFYGVNHASKILTPSLAPIQRSNHTTTRLVIVLLRIVYINRALCHRHRHRKHRLLTRYLGLSQTRDLNVRFKMEGEPGKCSHDQIILGHFKTLH